MVFLYASFLRIYTFMLTVLMLNKFTYSHEHTVNRRNQETSVIQYIVSPKQIKNSSVQTNYANVKLHRQFLALNNLFET